MTKQYPLSLPLADAEQLAEAKQKSGLPISQIILQCIRRSLPQFVAEHQAKAKTAPPARIVRENGRTLLSNGRKVTLADCRRAMEEFP